MGNCQAIDSAALVIEHLNGEVDRMYFPVAAGEIMKMNPGHYVVLLLTTTLYSSTAAGSTTITKNKNGSSVKIRTTTPLRITRIKLLKPNDTLALGHVYRLVTYQEVMKGLLAKKQAKMKQLQPDFAEEYEQIMANKQQPTSSEFEAVIGKADEDVEKKSRKVKHERHRSRNNNNTPANSAVNKSRAWQPSLKSISEAGS